MPTALIRSGKVATVRQDSAMWADRHATMARKLVPNSRYRSTAAAMSASSFRALEYLQQAPVIVVGACGDYSKNLRRRRAAAKLFADSIAKGPRLREVVESYGISYQFRALAGDVLTPAAEQPVLRISRHAEIKASALAQAIPADLAVQHDWLIVLDAWIRHMDRRSSPHTCDTWLPWAMTALSLAVRQVIRQPDVTIVADFLIARPDTFVREWTWEQARAAAERWHQGVRREAILGIPQYGLLGRVHAPTGFGRPDEIFDYTPWPLGVVVQGLLFLALDTPAALYEEGAEMHHCVGSYTPDVRSGRSLIYSIRLGEKRVATVELRPIPLDQGLVVVQLRGPCNGRVDASVEDAVIKFRSFVNRHFSGRSGRALSESLKIRPSERFRFASPLRSTASLKGC